MPRSLDRSMPEEFPEEGGLKKIGEDLRTQLETWRAFGIERAASGTPGVLNETGTAENADSLEALRSQALICQKCAELAGSRTQVVFGTGNPSADLVFVGEAPGFDEDKQGEPFVGKAGQLLTKIIEAMGYKRGKVYICNVLKCRPPQNRNPLPQEVANCRPYLIRQLELLKPRVLVALGKFAAQTLLETERPISQLRGKFFEYQGIPVMPTFHPAYLLRNESDKTQKKLVWEDMKQVMALLKSNPKFEDRNSK